MAHDHIGVFSSEMGAGSRQEGTSVENAGGYRFGTTHGMHAHGRPAFSGGNGYLRNLIEVIANAKVRRMQCELELRGIRYDPVNNRWVVRKSRPISSRPTMPPS